MSRSDLPSAALSFTSREVSRVAQVSLRQLQWWNERGVLSLTHRGRARAYLPKDVIEVLVIAELRRKGITLQSVRRILRFLRREIEAWPNPVTSSKTELYLVTDGKTVHLEEDHAAVIDRLKGARRPMLLISMSDLMKRLAALLQEGPRIRRGSRRRRTVEGQLGLFS